MALAFARSIGEYGSLVLLTGRTAFKTEVSVGLHLRQIESGNPIGAAAVSVVLLLHRARRSCW